MRDQIDQEVGVCHQFVEQGSSGPDVRVVESNR
jgi:hypothetical protein